MARVKLNLVQFFAELTKVFNTMNRGTLGDILFKFKHHANFVRMLRLIYKYMNVRENIGSILIEYFLIEDLVSQRDNLGPKLFSIYSSVVFVNAFRDYNYRLYVLHRTTFKLFDFRRFAAKRKTLITILSELLYTNLPYNQ